MRSRYPFDALHWLRHKRVDEQATRVNESAARTLRARLEEARAEALRLASEHSMAVLEGAERTRLEAGQLRVGDLQAVGDWRKGAEAELQAKAEGEQRAHEARVAEANHEAIARRALGSASSDAKLIDSHRNEFRAEREATEEAATEQWTARHFPSQRG